MRIGLLLTVSLVLAACSQAPDRSESSSLEAAPDSAAGAAPGIAVTAAPGVAFAYDYTFRLPSARIAGAQEAHAAACEKLGIARCRITGMRYRVIGENDIQAMLSFKLDPAIARAFGKNGIAIITAAEGTLVDAEITGTDAGAEIKKLGTLRDRALDELRRIDAELGKRGLPAAERAELQQQRAAIVQGIAAATDSSAEQRASLATTPMTFAYESGAAIRGFDASAPLKSALDTGIGSIQITFAVLLGAIAIFGPPGLVVLGGWLLWTRFRRRRTPAPAKPDTVASQ